MNVERLAGVDGVWTSYLGFPVHVSESEVHVFTAGGDFVCKARSVKEARLIVRGYRREDRCTRLVREPVGMNGPVFEDAA